MPDWLAAAAHTDLGGFGAGSAAVVVADTVDFTVDATGRFSETERRAIRVLNVRAAEPYLVAHGEENVDSSVTSIAAWTVAANGRVIESQKKDVNVTAAFAEFELFSDSKEKYIVPSGVEDGSLVGTEVLRQGRIAISGERFSLQGFLPTRASELHLSVPSGSVHCFLNHPDRVETVSQSANAAVFRVSNLPAIAHEDNSPPLSSLAAEVIVNYDPSGPAAVQSWEDAGRAYSPIFVGGEKPAPAVADETEQLASAKPDVLGKVGALYSFVSRQIRYVAVEVGIGGYRPHAAADVFQHKYGDCKDKANLLIAMLGHIGVRAYPALVGTRDDIEADPTAPTLTSFDHVIVALPIGADLEPQVRQWPAYDAHDHILWMDPTSEFDPLGQVPEMDQGVHALITYPDRGELELIPEPPPQRNGVAYLAQLRLDASGSGTAEVQAQYFGDSNARRHDFYRGRSEADLRDAFENRVARYVPDANLTQVLFAGTSDNSQQVAEKFSFSGDFGTALAGDSWFFQPLFLTGFAVPELSPRPRTLPFDLGAPYEVAFKYHVELPAGMRVERIPEPLSLQTEFGQLNVTYSTSGNALDVSETLSFTIGRIPPEKWAAFRDFVNSSLRAEGQRLRAVKAPA